ncbi:hypothetical protein [Clostridium butyricum]|uniref:hypothetical protein n=1 Tax=Clostridium butyricum TaxID=1492 RepID=UPI002ABD890C|nr:hypothetical protein [Clostridium butyricum]
MNEDDKKREGKSKSYRMLNLYERFNRGEVKSKKFLVTIYEVDEKTIQRDIDELRYYLESDEENPKTIVYNKNKKGYERTIKRCTRR